MDVLAARLRELLRDEPLLLPNAWDAAAPRLRRARRAVIATTSGGVARALGFDDGERTPVDEMLAAVARIVAAVDLPVTADMERGYGLEPAELGARLLATGAVGLNYEDTAHDGSGGSSKPRRRPSGSLCSPRPGSSSTRGSTSTRAGSESRGPARGGAAARGALREAGAACLFPILLDDAAELADSWSRPERRSTRCCTQAGRHWRDQGDRRLADQRRLGTASAASTTRSRSRAPCWPATMRRCAAPTRRDSNRRAPSAGS